MRRICRPTTLRLAACVAAVAVASADLATPLWAQSVGELTPYRVRVLLALDKHPQITDRLATRVAEVLSERAASAVGAAWLLETRPAPAALESLMLSSLDVLTVDDLPADLIATDADKLILLALGMEHGAFQLSARELDLRTRLLSAAVSWRIEQRTLVADEAFRAVLAVFSPLAEIEQVDDKSVTVRLRAGGLATLDPALVWIAPGDVMRPVLRFNDREGNARKIQPIEWTMLWVESVEGSTATCRLHSGLRSPLSGRRRGRVEQLALLVRPGGDSTRLVLRARVEPHRPLQGYEVYSHPPDSTATELVGRTDGQGNVLVPPGRGGLRVLLVKHGNELLARLPLVPGLEPVQTAEVPDDDQRLAAEGLITGMQEMFVDLVARRAVLIMRVRTSLEQGKVDEAKSLMEELRGLASYQELTQMIVQAKQRTVSSDPGIQKKIDRLFEDTQQVLNRFLDPRPVEQLEVELAKALGGRDNAAVSGGL